MRAWIGILLVAVVSLAGSGCVTYYTEPGLEDYEYFEQEPSAENSPLYGYFPLRPGTFWSYTGSGNEYASFSRSVVSSAGNRYQVREDNGGTVMANVYQITGDAVTLVNSQAEAYGNPNLLNAPATRNQTLLRSPLMVGNSWSNSNEQRSIVDTQARVESPGGIYDECIEVEVRHLSGSGVTHEFYARGIGLVQRVYQSGDTTVFSYLKDYRPSGQARPAPSADDSAAGSGVPYGY